MFYQVIELLVFLLNYEYQP